MIWAVLTEYILCVLDSFCWYIMANQFSNEGSSTAKVSGESSDSTVQLNIKTLDSRIYSFQVEKNVSATLPYFLSFPDIWMGLYVHWIVLMSNLFFIFELFQMPVSSFKEKIANEIGVPVGQQRLIFRGRVLKDDHLLSEYRIQPQY